MHIVYSIYIILYMYEIQYNQYKHYLKRCIQGLEKTEPGIKRSS